MATFETIENVAVEIKSKLESNQDKKNIAYLYAFNGSGKTRLSEEFKNIENENGEEFCEVLKYNAFMEDLFIWDNGTFTFHLNGEVSHLLFKVINEQDLEGQIVKNFNELINSKIEPRFDLNNGQISFILATGNKEDENVQIKISRGEESLFVWSIFYTVLELAISILNTENEEDRESEIFNNLKYVVIDDPISSIDDTKIIMMGIRLIELIKSCKNNQIKFLITTHHPLFFNLFYNKFKPDGSVKYAFLLSKRDYQFHLESQNDDSPFGYHFVIKKEIEKVCGSGEIERYHFNLFRVLLEKTANFFGYNHWYDCIPIKKTELKTILNLYSHGKLSEMENKNVSDEHKEIFKEAFNDFIKKYNFSKN